MKRAARGVLATGFVAILVCFATVFTSGRAGAQTTQALISGRLVHSRTGAPVGGARVEYTNAATGVNGSGTSDASGFYALPMLTPGFYRVRVEAAGFQAREVQELELAVAARLELDFTLRPLNDVWEAGQYRSVFLPGTETIVTFYGPDVDTSRSASFEATRGKRGALESTISEVINPLQVRDLPLNGRDVYTMLVTQPGVTADTGTARGLGLSITGQRPSSSNFMLDGLENNNYLVTGPLTAIAPEAIQEYRVSTNNFSAEYGRTAGFVANAVSRSGGNAFHGLGYFYLKNDALNANGFQENLAGLPRTPQKERQLGFQVGGPIKRERLFFSSAYEDLRSRSRLGEVDAYLPTPEFLKFNLPSRASSKLLTQYPSPAPGDGRNFIQLLPFEQPVSVDRKLALERGDWVSKRGADRVFGRVSINRVARPDFIWTPYKDFVSGLNQHTLGVAVGWTRTLSPRVVNEAKAGWSRDNLWWDRAHPEVPTLQSADGVALPGSPAFYAYRNDNKTWEFLDSLIWTRGRHVITAGGGLLLRSSEGYQTAGRDGQYRFDGLILFGIDRPSAFRASVDRLPLPALQQPGFDRTYRYRQFNLFVQDTFKASSRLALNYGLRYESFGAPRNTGSVKDVVMQFGPGNDFREKLASGRFVQPGGGDQELYKADRNNFAGRLGFSYDLSGSGRTLVRAAYGIFYDRPFDNLWQNLRANNFVLPEFTPRGTVDFLEPIASALQRYTSQAEPAARSDFPRVTIFDTNIRDGYAQTYFYGVQRQINSSWSAEIDGAGSLGRKLIVTDKINRDLNSNGGFISYRSSQGLSNYQALSAVARYRATRAQFQMAYTWSHSIDHQSDPLLGDFFDLLFTRISSGGGRDGQAALTLQGNLQADRGSSDFDQRHNLVFFSLWDLPRAFDGHAAGWLFRDWKFSQLAAFRSGFPYSVRGTSQLNSDTGIATFNNRANLIDPRAAVLPSRVAVPGGERLLNVAAFSDPPAGVIGTLGRNSFRGPGLFNIDLSLARSFPLKWLGEAGRLTFRADAFNFLNHANLNNPATQINSSDFGDATYGRQGQASGFPAVSPLNETARQVQLLLRVEF